MDSFGERPNGRALPADQAAVGSAVFVVLKKFSVLFFCFLLTWAAIKGPGKLFELLPQQEVGRYEFHHLPENWAVILANAQSSLPNRIDCTAASTPPETTTARVALDCTSINYSGKSRGIAVDLTPLFGMFAAVSTRVTPRITPWPSFNLFADFWARILPLILLLLFHDWKNDVRRSAASERFAPLLAIGAGVLVNILGRTRDWFVHGRFLGSAEADGILILEPTLSAPVVEELLFHGVMYRWLEKAGFGTAGMAIVTSVLFTLWHGHQITWEWRAPMLFVAGLVFFYVRHRTGSIIAAILAHMVANGLNYLPL